MVAAVTLAGLPAGCARSHESAPIGSTTVTTVLPQPVPVARETPPPETGDPAPEPATDAPQSGPAEQPAPPRATVAAPIERPPVEPTPVAKAPPTLSDPGFEPRAGY
ncbi:hypothetical protein [Nocardia sp. alder85J]|uniref:hypothetical protein n=1 Tax=Nocardia sp. alder85J TaxID=2862949 RepID=UPI001CD4D25E|nr:hypothetical protein [Nocardia sp. alder85J]MCX4094637.1 hypothetical protein [Nocardia sp. alder85J]